MVDKKFFTVNECAEYFRVCHITVRKWMKHPNPLFRLKAVNVGTGKRPSWRIPLQSILEFEQLNIRNQQKS